MPTKEQYRKHREYHKKLSLEYYYRNRDRILKKRRQKRREQYKLDPEARKKHIEVVMEYHKKWRDIWLEAPKAYDKKSIVYESEKLVAKRILPRNGFRNIILTSHNLAPSLNFPFFDILCEKNGSKCGVAVTITYFYSIRRREALKTLLKFFAMRYFICFLRPNFKEYILLEYDINKIPTGVFISKRKFGFRRKVWVQDENSFGFHRVF